MKIIAFTFLLTCLGLVQLLVTWIPQLQQVGELAGLIIFISIILEVCDDTVSEQLTSLYKELRKP